MEYLTLIRKNIKNKKSNFISIIILMFIVSISLTTIISLNKNIKCSTEEANEKVDTGDYISFMSDIRYNDEIVKKLNNSEYVEKTRVVDIVSLNIWINGEEFSKRIFASAYDYEDVSYDIYSKSENSFSNKHDKLEKGEIYLPISFKNNSNLEIGDYVSVKYNDNELSYKIKGFVEEPFIGASTIGVKIVFFSDEDLTILNGIVDAADDENITGTKIVHVYQKENSGITLEQFEKEINNVSNISNLSFLTITKKQAMTYTTIFNEMLSGFLYAFCIILFIITLIIVSYSISNAIETDSKNIGILKAIGFPKQKIRIVYMIQYLLPNIIGMLLGLILSPLLNTRLIKVFTILTGILTKSDIEYGIIFVIFLLMLILFITIIVLKTKGISEVDPIKAITGINLYNDKTYKVKLKINQRFLQLTLGIRQVTSNLKHYVSVIIISAVLVFFITIITGLYQIIKDPKMLSENLGLSIVDFYVDYNNTDLQEEVEEKIKNISLVSNSYNQFTKYLTVDNLQYYANIVDNIDNTLVYEGRNPKNNEEILITEILSEIIDKKIGDTVTIGSAENKADYKIVGFYRDTSDTGKTFQMSFEATDRIIANSIQYSVKCYSLANSDDTDKIINSIGTDYKDKIEIKAMDNSMMQDISMAFEIITYFVYFITALFTLITVVMVCNKFFVKEQKDFGIYKAIGFSSKKIRKQFTFRFLFVSLIGSVIGIFIYLLFGNKIINVLLKNMGIVKWEMEKTLFSILTPIIMITICFCLFSYMISKKIKKISVKNLIVE